MVVSVASDGREALDRLEHAGGSRGTGDSVEELPFDLVLMDLAMPVMDGWEATGRIRAERRWDDLPVLAMTAHAFAEERERCLSAGMQEHLTKPIDPELLYRALAHWGGRRPSASPSGSEPASPVSPHPGPPGKPTPAALEVDLRILAEEGCDVVHALQRSAGNASLYRRLLGSLAETQADAGQRVRASLVAGDPETALRVAHTVRGVGANLGADALAAAAGRLEDALGEGGTAELPLQMFEEQLTATLGSIRNLPRGSTDLAFG